MSLEKQCLLSEVEESKLKETLSGLEKSYKTLHSQIENSFTEVINNEPQSADKAKQYKVILLTTLVKQEKSVEKLNLKLTSLKLKIADSADIYEDDDEGLKLSQKQISNLKDIAIQKERRLQEVRNSALYVQQISNDINEITKGATKLIENVKENVENVYEEAQETVGNLVKSAENQQDLTKSKCYMVTLLVLAMVFILVLTHNS